jgi:flagellar hook-basal body complex protein FliE
MSIPRIEPLPVAASEAVSSTATGFASRPGEAPPTASFESVLGSALHEANAADAIAAEKTRALATGAIDDLHGTMISVKEADIAVRLVGSVRNKILDAFQELWRTSV